MIWWIQSSSVWENDVDHWRYLHGNWGCHAVAFWIDSWRFVECNVCQGHETIILRGIPQTPSDCFDYQAKWTQKLLSESFQADTNKKISVFVSRYFCEYPCSLTAQKCSTQMGARGIWLFLNDLIFLSLILRIIGCMHSFLHRWLRALSSSSSGCRKPLPLVFVYRSNFPKL